MTDEDTGTQELKSFAQAKAIQAESGRAEACLTRQPGIAVSVSLGGNAMLQASQRNFQVQSSGLELPEKHGPAFQASESQGWSRGIGSEEESLFASLVSKSF